MPLTSNVRPVKYKNIDSALHNFGHSFVSLMNYVDDEYICDLLAAAAKSSPEREVRIDLSAPSLPAGNAPQLVKSFEYWKAWLPRLLESQNVHPKSVGPVVLRYRITRMGREVIVEATDDRGHIHKVFVEHGL